jgi:hypothetical protein
MFDNYTDRARRCIFYARESVSESGSMVIETEHFLLGVLREDPDIIPRFLPSKTNEDIRAEVGKRIIADRKYRRTSTFPFPSSADGFLLTRRKKEKGFAITTLMLSISY